MSHHHSNRELLVISISTHSNNLQVGLVSPSHETIHSPSFNHTHSINPIDRSAQIIENSVDERQINITPSNHSPSSSSPHHPSTTSPTLTIPDHTFNLQSDQLDWISFESFLRHLLSDTLNLSISPLNQQILLSLPPSTPLTIRNRFTQLFFENLQASSLFLAHSTLTHLLATSHTSGTSIDLGTHSTLISFLHDSILLNHSCLTFPLGELDCDNYLISLLLTHDPNLPSRLCPTQPSPETVYQALSNLVTTLKANGQIRFQPELANLASVLPDASPDEDDNAITDVAQAIVSGKVDKLLGRQPSAGGAGSTTGSLHSRRSTITPTTTTANGRRLEATLLKESDTIIVSIPSPSHTHNSPTPLQTDFGPVQVPHQPIEIQIGNFRHRHAEPLFCPSVMSSILPSFTQHGLERFASRYTPDFIEDAGDGMMSVIEIGIKKLDGLTHQRRDVSEHVVLTGQAGLMCRTEGLLEVIAKYIGSKPAKIPDYFPHFKSKPELLGYLGGAIVGKLVFNDSSASKLWINKHDYAGRGVKRGGGEINNNSGIGGAGSSQPLPSLQPSSSFTPMNVVG